MSGIDTTLAGEIYARLIATAVRRGIEPRLAEIADESIAASIVFRERLEIAWRCESDRRDLKNARDLAGRGDL